MKSAATERLTQRRNLPGDHVAQFAEQDRTRDQLESALHPGVDDLARRPGA
jgi:hypothetical protein